MPRISSLSFINRVIYLLRAGGGQGGGTGDSPVPGGAVPRGSSPVQHRGPEPLKNLPSVYACICVCVLVCAY